MSVSTDLLWTALESHDRGRSDVVQWFITSAVSLAPLGTQSLAFECAVSCTEQALEESREPRKGSETWTYMELDKAAFVALSARSNPELPTSDSTGSDLLDQQDVAGLLPLRRKSRLECRKTLGQTVVFRGSTGGI